LRRWILNGGRRRALGERRLECTRSDRPL
jgi:hypothetical protein